MAYIGVSIRDIVYGVVWQMQLRIFPTKHKGGEIEVLCRAVCSSILLFSAVISLAVGTVLSLYGCDVYNSIQAIQIIWL